MNLSDLGKWMAFGTAAGVRIGHEDLNVTVVRVRPTGTRVLDELTIPGFREQSAAEWGAAYANFLTKLGVAHLAAAVLLPREDVMVRQIAFPGVSDKDLAAAIRFEVDSLNPYSEEEAAFDWARIGKTPSVLVGFTRRTVLEKYRTLFAEAGVKVASFTFSAPAIYSAIRLLSRPSPDGLLLLESEGDEVEVYGESPSRPLFSARLDGAAAARARTLAVAELRLAPETEPVALHDTLPRPKTAPENFDLATSALSYATALAGASLAPALTVNLLPAELRESSSRIRLVPTFALAALVLIFAVAALAYPKYADRHYMGLLHAEIQRIEPRARKAVELDRQIAVTRRRTQDLDRFRVQTKEDLDALNDLTAALAPPLWLNSIQLTRDMLTILGSTDQAAGLVKVIDGTRQFKGSSFTSGPARAGSGEAFGIRSQRKEAAP
jgi:Type IV pilus assembly protein PilM